MKRKSNRGDSRLGFPKYRMRLATLLVLVAVMLLASCGGETAGGSGEAVRPEETGTAGGIASGGEETSGEVALTPAEATVGPNESGAMPAAGRKKDPSQPPPENPPEGVRTFPATTNRNVEGPIAYGQDPPNQRRPRAELAEVWLLQLPRSEREGGSLHGPRGRLDNLPAGPAGRAGEYSARVGPGRYVLVSPYPGLFAPVVATAWRNQLALEGADDPRLRQFVDQFRISETAPRSGNGCESGVGEPES